MRGRRMKVSRSISLIWTLKLVIMATSLEWSKKRIRAVMYDQIGLPTTYGENVVKIGPVDPRIICLKFYCKKRTRNAWQILAYSLLGMPVSPLANSSETKWVVIAAVRSSAASRLLPIAVELTRVLITSAVQQLCLLRKLWSCWKKAHQISTRCSWIKSNQIKSNLLKQKDHYGY